MEVCDSTYVSFVLSFLYLLLMAAIVVYIVRLLTRLSPPLIAASRRPPALLSSFSLSSSFSSSAGYQKAFLLCTLLETTLRCLYFMLWPFIGVHCQPSLTSFHFHWIDGLGNLPPCLFMLAFSILVYSFARIYHILLLHGGKRQTVRLYLLLALLLSLNVIVTFTELAEWTSGAAPDSSSASSSTLSSFHSFLTAYSVYFITSASFTLAVLFFLYGYLLFFHVQSILNLSSSASSAATSAPPTPVQSPPASSLTPPAVLHSHPYRSSAAIAIRQVMPLPTNGGSSVESDDLEREDGSLSPHAIYAPAAMSVWRGSGSGGGALAADGLVPKDELNSFDVAPPDLRDETTEPPSSSSDEEQQLFASSTMSSTPPPAAPPALPAPAFSFSSFPLPYNPMRRLAVLSGICTLCLFLRTSLLLLTYIFFDGIFSAFTTLAYFSLSELVPIALMLTLLDANGGSGRVHEDRDRADLASEDEAAGAQAEDGSKSRYSLMA